MSKYNLLIWGHGQDASQIHLNLINLLHWYLVNTLFDAVKTCNRKTTLYLNNGNACVRDNVKCVICTSNSIIRKPPTKPNDDRICDRATLKQTFDCSSGHARQVASTIGMKTSQLRTRSASLPISMSISRRCLMIATFKEGKEIRTLLLVLT